VQLTGAQALVRSLEEQGVEVVFGLPGGAILPAYDPLLSSSLRHILVRHEQGAGHAAEGYAWATGRTGVCIATSGPGATNLVTALADAYMDSVPMVAITGQVPTAMIGSDAFQEVDITGITLPITKHNELVTDFDRIPAAIAEAFHIATTGRPGPVLVDLPKDILQAKGSFSWPPALNLPGYRLPGPPDSAAIRAAAALLHQARRPVLYVGGGVIKSDSHAELLRLAELAQAPVTTTLMARGAFPDAHPLALGMPGMHGTYTAVSALQEADLVVALGARFDDRVTGSLPHFAPRARIVHADIDPAEIGKNRHPDVAIVGDLKPVLAQLADAMAAEIGRAGQPRHGRLAGRAGRLEAAVPAALRPAARRAAQAAARGRAAVRDDRRRRDRGRGRRPAPDARGTALLLRPAAQLGQLRRGGHDGLRGARRDGRAGRPARRAGGCDRRRRAASR